MKKDAVKIICQNRKAYFDYFIDDVIEAGIVLIGPEVKSVRLGKVNINDGFARIHKGEVYLHNTHISPYPFTPLDSYDPTRTRKLLLHRQEIKRLIGKTEEKGYTLIPLKLYFRDHRIKIALGLAKGKKKYDKRETIRRRDEEREMQRQKKNRR
ncbi:SsrA-binding protein SmpB [Desulfobacca acetoxidans]|uniref:SsrA-binding protein n=1 Tax=Desulfobacca acetoxidans (strain ATCC 700848 / DSM 11109 / ASRB2) TaxID=880072 RepID=F2NF77_DESAR|nr:SsrA-binding protein SmpB [Desulfobacca acetoxidans]AEB08632.1 SsrA-binding protein [Desulfobacca acetoxidans DSM 11109]